MSSSNKKINYAHNYDNTINMISRFDDVVNVIIVKYKHKKHPLNTITSDQSSKVVLLRPTTSLDQDTTSTPISKYKT